MEKSRTSSGSDSLIAADGTTLPSHFKPYEAQPAATLLLLKDDPFRVLTVTRNARSFFPSAMVFPGGMVEPDDYEDSWHDYLSGHEELAHRDRALRIAACRETWEEAAIAGPRLPFEQRPKIPPTHAFGAHLHQLGARLDLDAIVPFSRWMTPPEFERRYDTHMFIALAPDDAEAMCDGDEIVGTHWFEPREAISLAQAGDSAILFSTYFNMCLLAQAQTAEAAIAEAAARTVVPITPRVVHDAEGRWIKIREDAGYPVTQMAVSPALNTDFGKQR